MYSLENLLKSFFTCMEPHAWSDAANLPIQAAPKERGVDVSGEGVGGVEEFGAVNSKAPVLFPLETDGQVEALAAKAEIFVNAEALAAKSLGQLLSNFMP